MVGVLRWHANRSRASRCAPGFNYHIAPGPPHSSGEKIEKSEQEIGCLQVQEAYYNANLGAIKTENLGLLYPYCRLCHFKEWIAP